jgi:hypothetical protein
LRHHTPETIETGTPTWVATGVQMSASTPGASIAERTRAKMAAARRKGKRVGGRPTLGYDVDPKGGRLVVNEREAAIVREVFELYL